MVFVENAGLFAGEGAAGEVNLLRLRGLVGRDQVELAAEFAQGELDRGVSRREGELVAAGWGP